MEAFHFSGIVFLTQLHHSQKIIKQASRQRQYNQLSKKNLKVSSSWKPGVAVSGCKPLASSGPVVSYFQLPLCTKQTDQTFVQIMCDRATFSFLITPAVNISFSAGSCKFLGISQQFGERPLPTEPMVSSHSCLIGTAFQSSPTLC